MSTQPFHRGTPEARPDAWNARDAWRAAGGLSALVFDVDGTLADTEETHREAFNDAFMRFGLEWEWSRAEYRDLLLVSGGRERLLAYFRTLPVSDAERARLCALAPAIHRRKTELYTELIGDGRCPLRPGVARMIEEARGAGLRLAIASTTTMANVDSLLSRHLGPRALQRFHTIACGDLVARKKPAPDLYHRVLATLALPADRCIAFEDSRNGLRAAKSAGLYTVVTPTAWTFGESFPEADLLLPHLGDADHPLSGAQAASVGGAWLGIAELRALHAAAVPIPTRRPHR